MLLLLAGLRSLCCYDWDCVGLVSRIVLAGLSSCCSCWQDRDCVGRTEVVLVFLVKLCWWDRDCVCPVSKIALAALRSCLALLIRLSDCWDV